MNQHPFPLTTAEKLTAKIEPIPVMPSGWEQELLTGQLAADMEYNSGYVISDLNLFVFDNYYHMFSHMKLMNCYLIFSSVVCYLEILHVPGNFMRNSFCSIHRKYCIHFFILLITICSRFWICVLFLSISPNFFFYVCILHPATKPDLTSAQNVSLFLTLPYVG